MNELHVKLGRIKNLTRQSKDSALFVRVILNHMSSSDPFTADSRTVSVTDSKIAETIKVPLRRSKGTTKKFQIRKAKFEIWNHTEGGFFSRDKEKMLGVAVQELDPLLDHVSVSGELPIVDGNRRKLGGKLQVTMSLKVPLESREFAERRVQTLMIGEYPPLARVAADPRENSLPQTANADTDSNVVAPPAAPSAPSQTPTLKRSLSAQLKICKDPHSVDNIISYDALTFEIELIQQRKATLTDAAKDSEVYEDLELREQALETKKQMLEIEMQSGSLTLDGYLDMLRPQIENERSIASILLKQNRRDDAARVLKRAKIMEAEVAGALE